MTLQMKGQQRAIHKALVLLTDGPDKVFLYSNMPCPYVAAALPCQEPLVLEFSATYNKGEEYVKENFGLEPEVQNCRHF